MHPLEYSSAIPPHIRVGQFVADEPRLGWMFKYLRHVPRAEAYVVGGTARDAVRGVLPKGLHVVIRNVPLKDLNDTLRKMGTADTQDDSTIFFRPDHFKNDDALEVSIPRDGRPEPYAPISYDLGRRDFTMNAMAYSLNSGLLIDPFGGARDLHRRELRAVGRPSARFEEKPRRALRALRLASEHRYGIAGSTWKGLKQHLPRLNRVVTNDDGQAVFETPRGHIGHEFLRTLSGHPNYGLQLWRDSGASHLFTPELEHLNDIHHKGGQTALQRAEKTLEDLGHPVPTLVFASLLSHLEDLALDSAKKLITRLHLHNAHPHFNHEDALWMLEHKNILEEAEPEHMPASLFENIFGKDRGQHLLTFLHATHRSSGQHTKTRDRLHQATKRRQELVTDIKKPQLLRGRDLESLGVMPGPKYRKILAKIRDAQLDGHVSDHDEAMNYARNLLAAQVL
jgi:tRNA nucleotidyltransferase/poly(A) polymerase